MEFRCQFQGLFLIGRRKWVFVVVLVAITHLLCQSLMLPYGNALLSLLPVGEVPIKGKDRFSSRKSDAELTMIDGSSLVNASELAGITPIVGQVEDADNFKLVGVDDREPREKVKDKENNVTLNAEGLDNDPMLVKDTNVDHSFPLDKKRDTDWFASENGEIQEDDFALTKTGESRPGLSLKQILKPSTVVMEKSVQDVDTNLILETTWTIGGSLPSSLVRSAEVNSSINITFPSNLTSSVSTSNGLTTNNTSFEEQFKELPNDVNHILLPSDFLSNVSIKISNSVKKKMKSEMPPKSVTSIYQMNRLLVRHRRASRAMRPRWSSARDQEILAAKSQIENSPVVRNDRDLYAPLFRNVSLFKRSYELMERILRVYVYKDGEKPIFHQPILKGLYASEGWFMKLMEGNRQFSVKDPRKAHLFYMPFSSRMLEYTLYVRNSHNRTNLRQYLKNYSEKIAAKYPFWNRTGGADHFLVACHDWAPYETRHHMEHCIKALCNADVTAGFKIGRDVSLPETYVRAARNPLRDLGGKPPSQRHILAFYAGNIHGYLRPILLNHWKDKDADMKIFGPLPPGVASKMNYIQHMKSSKYCICPKGYEVNSPRVVEAFSYECVPVIISDNFVPPFFEVLNWDAFSVILAEEDIPNLKSILLSIPQEKYLEMQLAVRKVQQHFLWHAKPTKYDLFHMTLHSIWHNRVFQIKQR